MRQNVGGWQQTRPKEGGDQLVDVFARSNRTMSRLRCAIYTRGSSDQGLEQNFNSLHAQREAAEAYIKSQAHEGWKLHRESYDDGGFSGGSMERPALQRLLKDPTNGRIGIIVVYKVDRPTRSLSDFAKLIEIFEANKVSFERVHVLVSYCPRSHMRRREVLLPANASGYVQPMPEERRIRLVLAIAQGKAWLREVLSGMPTEAIAGREGKSERAIRLTLSLAFLDPTLVKAALQGSLPRSVSARRLLDAPANWHDQWRALGLSRPS